LSNPWNPRATEIMAREGAKIQEAIEHDSQYATWDMNRRDAEKSATKAADAERKWIKCQRLIRMIDTVALSAALEKSGPPDVIDRYRQMVSDEAGFLTSK